MKLVALALALFPVASFAFEVSDPQIVQMLDGHVVRCLDVSEGGKLAYTAEVAKLGQADGLVTLALNVGFELCFRAGDIPHFVPRSPLDPVYSRDPQGNEIHTEYHNPELVLGNAGYTRLQVAAVVNQPTSKVAFDFSPTEFLDEQELRDYADGKPVRLRLSVLYRSIGTLYPARGDAIPLGYQFGGSYTVFFTLKK